MFSWYNRLWIAALIADFLARNRTEGCNDRGRVITTPSLAGKRRAFILAEDRIGHFAMWSDY
jgi:hypothetical protein